MSEQTSLSTETTGRRQRKNVEEQSGGGKILPIILLVLVLGLGFALFKRNSSANAQADNYAATNSMLASNITELRTKLMLEHGNAGVVQTNHQAMLDRANAQVGVFSNRLVQSALLLSNAQHQVQTAQIDLQAKAAAVASLEAERNDLQLRLEPIPSLAKEIADMKQRQAQAMFERDRNAEALGRVSLEKADLERKLEDPLFLRVQERRVLEAAELRQRAAAGQRINISDPRMQLKLQPDGSVLPVVTAVATPRKQ